MRQHPRINPVKSSMIVTCPSCASKHEFSNAVQAPGDVKITCQSCGHKWIELESHKVIDVRPLRKAGIKSDDLDDLADEDIERLLRASRDARENFTQAKKQRRRAGLAWAGYAAFSIAPLGFAAAAPEVMVAAAPITYQAYQKVGYEVNIYGLEIKRVAQDYKVIEGQRVLTIKGDLVNITGNIRRIPSLRFALRDGAGNEVYNWVLDTAARPLRPGEITGFVTRVQDPPDGAKDLQIRFAKEVELVTASTTPIQ